MIIFRLLAILSGLLRLSLLASQYIFLDVLLSYKRRHMGFCNCDGDLYIVILAADESLSGVHLSWIISSNLEISDTSLQ